MPAMSVADDHGVIIGSNLEHQSLLGRPREAIVGHMLREWTPPEDIDRVERVFRRCLAGEPVSLVRSVVHADGRPVTTYLQTFSLRFAKRVIVVGSFSQAEVTSDAARRPAIDVAEYVAELTSELSILTSRSGLTGLGRLLGRAADQAGQIASLLGDQSAKH